MSYTYQIGEVLEEYDDVLYKMNQVKIIVSDGCFEYKSFQPKIIVTDNASAMASFMCRLSRNQKELVSFFATDAFSVFTGPVQLKLIGIDEQVEVIGNVNIQNIALLPPFLAGIPHQLADSNWVASTFGIF